MIDLIENLRQKPIREKRRLALIISGSVTLVIFLLWLSFFSSFYGSDSPVADSEEDLFSPLTAIIQNIRSAF